MNPVVLAVGGFDDGLVEVGVWDEPVEPAVEDVHVGMGKVVVPVGVAGRKCPKPGSQRILSSR